MEIPSEHPQAGICFLGNLVHMDRPGQVFTDFHSKVGLSGHSLQDVFVQLEEKW